MTNKKFLKEFERFNIPKDQLLEYKDANQFASQFKRCSILEYGNISYSNTSLDYSKNLKNRY